jgi:hypothetical protein
MLLMVVLPHRAAPLTAPVVTGLVFCAMPDASGWTNSEGASRRLLAAVHACVPRSGNWRAAEIVTAIVMAGLVPAIHVFLPVGTKNVDARDKPGHDDGWCINLAHGPIQK